MISRLSAIAATVAVLATASLAFAESAHAPAAAGSPAATHAVRTVELQRVVITGKRAVQAPL